MRPANLSRSQRSPGRRAGEADLRDRAEPVSRFGDELLDPRGERAGLLLQVLADRTELALDAAAVLLDRPLDAVTALTQFALELGPRAADLALEAVAGGGATPLVALELALDRLLG